MHDDTSMLVTVLLLGIYAVGGTLYYIIQEARRLLKERKQFQENLKIAEASLAAAEDYAGDLESGYAMMATNIEAVQGELGDIHRWMDSQDQHMQEHCVRLDQIAAFRIVIHPIQPFDYTGSDGYEEEPYSESDCPTLTPLPEYVQTAEIEGLNEL